MMAANLQGAESSSSKTDSEDDACDGEMAFKCSVCFENFTNKKNLADHLQVHFKEVAQDTVSKPDRNGPEISKTHSNNRSDEPSDTVIKCLDTHSDITPHKCPICSQCFVSSEGRDRHMKVHGGVKSFECNVCKQLFFASHEYRRHMNTHGDNPEAKPFECTKCDKRFLTNRSMKLHMRTHDDKALECTVCERNFLSSYHLNIHMMTHDGVTPRKCMHCEKKFCSESDLRKHMKTHKEIEPFECLICKKSFNNQSALNGHMRLHSEKIPTPSEPPNPTEVEKTNHECEICNRSFTQSSQLTAHLESHENEKTFFGSQLSNEENYECRICGKSFAQSSELASHMRTHTAEEQYRCFVSDERFRQRQIVIQNRKQQSTVIPKSKSKTSLRSKTKAKKAKANKDNFAERSDMIQIEPADDKPFRCFVCDEQFASRDDVLEHLKSHDGNSEESNKVPTKQEVSQNDQ